MAVKADDAFVWSVNEAIYLFKVDFIEGTDATVIALPSTTVLAYQQL